MKSYPRVLIAANRLPVTVVGNGGEPQLVPSTGGLATGLRGPHERGEGLWFGWPGPLQALAPEEQRAVLQSLDEMRYRAIELSPDLVDRYYNGFANGVLWPTFHYLIDRVPMVTPDWDAYRQVNEQFADAIAAEWRQGDVLWVHDFHLMLLPSLLRARLPAARIGFFLHIPFPSSEVFRVLPWREPLLRGLLGADLIGFHTLSYMRHFAASLLRILGLEADVDRVFVGGREVRLAAHPMGVDVRRFAELAADPATVAEAAAVRAEADGAQIVLGVDRLDYTKGILRRLLAFERLLELRGPEAAPVRLLQVAVTSRADVTAYQTFKRDVDELVGRINGRFSTPSFTPIRYLNTGQDQREVAALYLAADVLLVTPLRDGLNLVAKEFLATRVDGDGVLVLSEFAGAAAELPEALSINPYDVDGVARTLALALSMPENERRQRMAAMRDAVGRHDIQRWVRAFLDDLMTPRPPPPRPKDDLRAAIAELTAAMRARRRLCLFLDYDGTLMPFAPRPELAPPDPDLLELLARLGARPDTAVHLVSGRPREFLDRWFGRLPIDLHAEHGLTSRTGGANGWSPPPGVEPEWRARVIPLLRRVAAHIPGSFVEEKAVSVAWHYRQVEPAFAADVAKELRLSLLELLSNVGVAVVDGNRVLEIRPQGLHKGQIVARALEANGHDTRALVLGDDGTDEEMFCAAPKDSITVHVGDGASAARFQVQDPRAARALLATLVS